MTSDQEDFYQKQEIQYLRLNPALTKAYPRICPCLSARSKEKGQDSDLLAFMSKHKPCQHQYSLSDLVGMCLPASLLAFHHHCLQSSWIAILVSAPWVGIYAKVWSTKQCQPDCKAAYLQESVLQVLAGTLPTATEQPWSLLRYNLCSMPARCEGVLPSARSAGGCLGQMNGLYGLVPSV